MYLHSDLRLIVAVLMLFGSGCRKQVDQAVFLDAQKAFDEGEAKFSSRQYQEAAGAYELAVTRGGLNVDLHCIAQAKRAESLVRLSRFDEAHAILDRLEQGSPDIARVHLVRCFLFEKEGKPQEAAEQYRLARQYDPEIQKISP